MTNFHRLLVLLPLGGLPLLPWLKLSAAEAPAAHAQASRTFNVRTYGATGDGVTLDSAAINQAISECAAAGGGQVFIPPGRYLSGTLHLRSHVTLFLDAGSTLVGTTNLASYAQPEIPSFMPEAKWGKWHRALILGENVEGVSLVGAGVIDGNNVFDPDGEERMRGPHTILFVNSRRFILRDLTIRDSANYAILFQVSDDVELRNLNISGGWDGVHFRGAPGRSCRNVSITDCRFFTGDDSIAGRYWDNVLISGCTINSSCNGIRLIGPATQLIVNNCLFYGPGAQPHRSSDRTNMLSGIILQPGAWDRTEGLLDNVLLANNTMWQVASPVTIWTKPGNPVGTITVVGLHATGVYRSPFSVESWSELPITNVVLRAATIEFAGGGSAAQASEVVKGPGVDARPLPSWGVYARNVQKLTLEDVRLSLKQEDTRPVVMAENVQQLMFDGFRFPRVPGVSQPLMTTNCGTVSDLDAANRPTR
jgi:hypothetical protein